VAHVFYMNPQIDLTLSLMLHSGLGLQIRVLQEQLLAMQLQLNDRKAQHAEDPQGHNQQRDEQVCSAHCQQWWGAVTLHH
jgi:hypothetical protein